MRHVTARKKGLPREPAMDPVKFVALDKEDLEVVSAHLQDAEIKVADVHWRPPRSGSSWRSIASTGPPPWQWPPGCAVAAQHCASSGCSPASARTSIPPARTRSLTFWRSNLLKRARRAGQ